tara:strand:+ start:180 stop:707 length:528 start_codon:yes stop_codon:yes gene_type:complete
MKRFIILTPLIVVFVICIFVLLYLLSNKDPSKPPSVLINKSVPLFESVSLYDSKNIIKTQDIKNKKVLINFFASWCLPCKVEHPLLFDLSNNYPNLYLLGFNHKDKENDAKQYLSKDGNPYNFVGIDSDGMIALEFGVFGLPETFLINENGKIIYKFMGPLTKDIIKNEIKPLLQ